MAQCCFKDPLRGLAARTFRAAVTWMDECVTPRLSRLRGGNFLGDSGKRVAGFADYAVQLRV
jgi:hypothetical protein